MKILKNKRLLFFIVVGLVAYVSYANNLLAFFLPQKTITNGINDSSKVINVTVENFKPKEVKYDTQEAKFYKEKLNKIH